MSDFDRLQLDQIILLVTECKKFFFKLAADISLLLFVQDGTFLVRKSKQGGDTQPYTLAVLYQGHVYNLKMRNRSDGQVALGEEKHDELVSLTHYDIASVSFMYKMCLYGRLDHLSKLDPQWPLS